MLDAAADTTSTARARSDERRLLASVGISALGTWSYNVGIAVYAFQQTGSTAWVAAATVGRYVPALFITSIGSAWADRRPRREVAVASDLVCALIMVALTVAAMRGAPLVLAIALAAVSSGVARVQSSSALACVADLVPESRLARAATSVSTVEAIATAAGPAIASLVLVVATTPVLFALNGLTFAVSALLLASLRTLARHVPHGPAGDVIPGTADATFRASVRLVRPLLALRAAAAFVYGADVVLLAVIATQQLRQGTAGYGWLLAAAGAGGLLAAAWVRTRSTSLRVTGRGAGGLWLYTLPLLLFLASPTLAGGVGVQLVRGAGCVLVSAVVIAGLQRTVPAGSSARVFGRQHVVVLVGTSTGAIVVPVLLDRYGLEATIVATALLPALVGLVALVPLRRFDRDASGIVALLDPSVDRLRSLALFADANRSTLYLLAEQITVVEVPAGTPIVSEGEHSDALYVLDEGVVEVFQSRAGSRVHLRSMSAPAYFGEIGLVHGVPRTATVVSGDECRLWRIPAEAFVVAAGQAGLSNALTEGARVRLDT